MIISFFIAFFAWGIPQLALAFLGLCLLLAKIPSTLLKCHKNIIRLSFLSIPPFVIGILKNFNPVEVVQASSGFSLFFIILIACTLNSADKHVKTRLNLDMSEYQIQSVYNYLTLVILISTALSFLTYFKVGSDILYFFTGDVSSSYISAATYEEFDRAMSPMLIATSALSFSFLYSVFYQDSIKLRKIAVNSLIALIAFAFNLLLSGSRGLIFTAIVLLMLIFFKTVLASAAKSFYQLKLNIKSILVLCLAILMVIGALYILLPRINSLLSEISALSGAIGFAFRSPYPSTVASTSTRVDVIKELFFNISLLPQGFGSPLMANVYSNGPKYATEMQIINYFRMGGIIIMPLFIVIFRQNRKYFPTPLSKIYSSYIDFMLVFSLTNPLFFNFQMFFGLVSFSFLVDHVLKIREVSFSSVIN